eukprot:12788890-Alexandrium_andersonii.AAC.1
MPSYVRRVLGRGADCEGEPRVFLHELLRECPLGRDRIHARLVHSERKRAWLVAAVQGPKHEAGNDLEGP